MPKPPVNVIPHPRHRHVSHSFNAPLLNAKHITLSFNLPTRFHAFTSYHDIHPSTGSSHTLLRTQPSSSQSNIGNHALTLHDPNLISSTTAALPMSMLPAHCQIDSTILQIREFYLPLSPNAFPQPLAFALLTLPLILSRTNPSIPSFQSPPSIISCQPFLASYNMVAHCLFIRQTIASKQHLSEQNPRSQPQLLFLVITLHLLFITSNMNSSAVPIHYTNRCAPPTLALNSFHPISSHLIKIQCHPLQLNPSSLEQSPRPRSLSSFAFRLSHPSFYPNTTLFTPTTSCYTTTPFLPFHSIFKSYKSFSIDRMPLRES